MKRRDFIRSSAALAGAVGLGGTVARPDALAALTAPRPGRAIKGARLCYNENPMGVTDKAWQAVMDARATANRYPDELISDVRALLARKHEVKPENIVLGNGSTEILQTTIQAYASANEPLVLADPTFEDVVKYQKTFSYNLEKVPLDARHAHDLGRMSEIADGAHRPAVVYICNPNNPTATITPSAEVDAWIQDAPETTLFLVDEAYFEYVDDPNYWTAIKWIDRPNVIVARTFSKVYGMAGMRLGYAVAHEDTAARLSDWILDTSNNAMALTAGKAGLLDDQLVPQGVAVNKKSKKIAMDTLDDLGLEYLPSQANFIMHRIPGDVRDYIKRMKDADILVGRPFPPMLGWNRVSFGLPEEMELWADTLRGFRMKGWV